MSVKIKDSGAVISHFCLLQMPMGPNFLIIFCSYGLRVVCVCSFGKVFLSNKYCQLVLYRNSQFTHTGLGILSPWKKPAVCFVQSGIKSIDCIQRKMTSPKNLRPIKIRTIVLNRNLVAQLNKLCVRKGPLKCVILVVVFVVLVCQGSEEATYFLRCKNYAGLM